ncbi:MAG: extracellular solute-binding protein [Parvibaculum sp.]|uniref:extracellular solute-binding protein n=1 Tax=Parvibaculum sp. TaxID=2024848 RepID=UPI002ABA59F8|nr:extracellular solute-binding protein [Parvibaculum sp.]MDZ4381457.1 extracellular solute-binding protein [Parvibaculum sp.]
MNLLLPPARGLPVVLVALAALFCGCNPAAGAGHAIAMHGDPLYPPDFTHFNYVDPDAPKGGSIVFGATGSFDSLNPFIVRGTAAIGLREHVFESLMARGYDEPFTLYGLLAETVEMPDDRSSVTFSLNPKARFSDGKPVTVDDVIYSLETLRDKGRPNYKTYYSKVEKVEKLGPRKVKFVFGAERDREIPLILGLMPIVPKHVYETRDFGDAGYDTPVGSGPYLVERIEPGARIVYRRDMDYWGASLPVNAGQNNIDRLTYEYFRDANASFEAFKTGIYHARPEDDPGRWTTGYDFPALRAGKLRKEIFESGMPSGMYALVFNARRPVFADRRVREALIQLFNFEWVNRNLYYGAYVRTQSFFDNSELGSHGREASARERELLAPFPDAVTPGIMAHGWQAPEGDPSGQDRENRMRAVALLREADFEVRDGRMTNTGTGQPLAFEILVATPAEERLALTYTRMARRVGVEATVRNVDPSQYQARRDSYQYDMIFNNWFSSLSPGNEQSFYWGSEAADVPGTRNYMGVKEPAVDAMIAAMLEARSREDFIAAVRAMDRVLLSRAYMIPLFHQPDQWLALWKKVKVPQQTSRYGYRSSTWWIEED